MDAHNDEERKGKEREEGGEGGGDGVGGEGTLPTKTTING
jgi:hypothetical protein